MDKIMESTHKSNSPKFFSIPLFRNVNDRIDYVSTNYPSADILLFNQHTIITQGTFLMILKNDVSTPVVNKSFGSIKKRDLFFEYYVSCYAGAAGVEI